MSQSPDLLAALLDDDLPDTRPAVAKQVMAFAIKRFVLQALLEKAITVVPTRDVMPVLKCFQLIVDPQRLRVVASDLEMTLIASTPMVAVTAPGVAVFPARKLLDIIKSADDAEATIAVTGTSARIHIGRASWTLQLPGGHDYPALPAISDAAFAAIERKVFQDAISTVRYAASRDPNRANLNIIDIRAGKLTACDGSRIQQISISDFPISLIIPISAVDDLLRLLKICDLDTILVGQSDDKLIFRFGSDMFIVNKFRAQFPDLEATMLRPALENKHDLSIDRSELLATLRRVRINADVESSAIAVHLNGDGTLTVLAKDKFGNTATETIDCVYTGAERHLVVNHRFLADMIHTYGDATCTFRLGDDTKTRRTPMVLRNSVHGSVGLIQQMQSDWVGQ